MFRSYLPRTFSLSFLYVFFFFPSPFKDIEKMTKHKKKQRRHVEGHRMERNEEGQNKKKSIFEMVSGTLFDFNDVNLKSKNRYEWIEKFALVS